MAMTLLKNYTQIIASKYGGPLGSHDEKQKNKVLSCAISKACGNGLVKDERIGKACERIGKACERIGKRRTDW